jgi:hypothetical protein
MVATAAVAAERLAQVSGINLAPKLQQLAQRRLNWQSYLPTLDPQLSFA